MSSINVKVVGKTGELTTENIDEWPDTCPKCKLGMKPTCVGAYMDPIGYGLVEGFYLVVRCTINECQIPFVAYYERNRRHGETFHHKRSFIPFRVKTITFPESIASVSEVFIKTYHQAEIAEANNLTEVCGCGYRRALEFLIKDFLIASAGGDDERERIKTSLLGKCIERIDDANIRATAERAAWLGNDETHYIRMWNDFDLNNLKDLIQLVVYWIDATERTRKYKETMD